MSSALKKQVSPGSQNWVERVAEIVHAKTGIQLGPKQTSMIESRLAKRFIDLKIEDPSDYLAYLEAHEESETQCLISLITTHHTYFFREQQQFEYLEKTALPQILETLKKENRKSIRIWSAACSRGQEVYTLTMFLKFHLKRMAPDVTFEILGTDVDAESVGIAKNGVYKWDDIKGAPTAYLADHWARGTGEIAEFVKVKPSLKNHCKFETQNLIHLKKGVRAPGLLGINDRYDIIFCRNVFIYFEPKQIKAITEGFLENLHPKGFLNVGLSESLFGLDLPVKLVGPSAYIHLANEPKAEKVVSIAKGPAAQSLIRVLCVDDSPTVLKLLQKILTKESGFEVVGTAENGLKASEFLKSNKVDVLTLDIHMPEQDGISYLEKNINVSHPPVVMVSSVSREDSGLGIRSFELGAVDYVEKPSLSNMAEKSEEIKLKLRMAVTTRKTEAARNATTLAKSFEKKLVVADPGKKARVLIVAPGNIKQLEYTLKQLSSPHAPTFVLIWGAPTLVESLSRQIPSGGWSNLATQFDAKIPPQKDSIFFLDFKTQSKAVFDWIGSQTQQASIAVFGEIPKWVATEIPNKKHIALLLEDQGQEGSEIHQNLKKSAKYFIPYTGIGYHLDEALTLPVDGAAKK